MAVVVRRQPFASLELPQWARMTDAEMDELDNISDCDSEVSDCSDFDDESESEYCESVCCSSGASTGCSSPRARPCWADLAEDEDEELCQLESAQAQRPSWADMEDGDEEEYFPIECLKVRKLSWADMAEEEEEEEHEETFCTAFAGKAAKQSWADMAEAEEALCLAFVGKARWADLIDEDEL